MDDTQDSGLFARMLAQNPLALGLIAIVIGALIGALIPESRKEHELLGPHRDQLADKAQATVQDYARKAGVVAGAAQSAAQDTLEQLKSPAQDALDQAKAVALDGLNTVKEEAEHQGLLPDAIAHPSETPAA